MAKKAANTPQPARARAPLQEEIAYKPTVQEPENVLQNRSPAPADAEIGTDASGENAAPVASQENGEAETRSGQIIHNGRSIRDRIPFGSHQKKLEYPVRKGFVGYWFKDKPGRLDRAEQAGYAFVKDAQGRNITRPGGTRDGGGVETHYLMEIPEEWYKADFAAQQRQIDEIDSTIRGGRFEAKQGDNRYVPREGIKFEQGT